MRLSKKLIAIIIIGFFIGTAALPSNANEYESSDIGKNDAFRFEFIINDSDDYKILDVESMTNGPDLTVTGMLLIWYSEKQPKAPCEVWAGIKNIGSSSVTKSFYVELYMDGKSLGGASWNQGLNPGDGITFIAQFQWANDWGPHTIKVWADSKNNIDESNENNNVYSMTASAGDPPDKPSTPSGKSTGYPGTSYTYSTKANDPNGQKIKYYFNWGDGNGEWTELVNSGTTVSKSHVWNSPGTYRVKVKAQNEIGLDSEWSSSKTVTIASNFPPGTPNRPSGEIEGKRRQQYTYTTKTNDPDGDMVYYQWYWGDGITSEWMGPYDSGSICEASYSWNEKGNYDIIVRSKDEKGLESDWSNPLSVSMPKIIYSNSFDQRAIKMLERFPILKSLLNL
jgi:hypothetical protein